MRMQIDKQVDWKGSGKRSEQGKLVNNKIKIIRIHAFRFTHTLLKFDQCFALYSETLKEYFIGRRDRKQT